MKRATIMMDGSGRVAVPSDIANVWMSEMELVTLFDVIAPTLRAAVRAVYRSGVLQSCEVERRIRDSKRNFEAGFLTDEPELLMLRPTILTRSGQGHCSSCLGKNYCPDRIR